MTYDEIVAASKAYADRNDIEVANNIDVFIVLAEARMNRLLKTREQSSRVITPTVDLQEYYSLPPDYAGMRDIQISVTNDDGSISSAPLTMLTPELFNIKRNAPFNGRLYYSIIANQIQVFPIQAAGKHIEIIYYQKVPNLNSHASLNWVSEGHPDMYVAGVTGEISLFAKDYETAGSWFDRMGESINELDSSDVMERWSGGPLVMRIG